MIQAAWLVIGSILAGCFIFYGRSRGERHELRVLSVGLIIAAFFYVGFAFYWGSAIWIIVEMLGVLLYSIFVFLGLKLSVVWLAFGWALHPVWDGALHLFGPARSVAPEWYVVACISFDLVVAGYILYRYQNWKGDTI